MKSIVQNVNKTLLEKFPLIWNTRLLWMLLIAALTHILFFALGLNAFNDPTLLHEWGADDIYVHNGMLLFSIICSILIIVVWLIILFRNNSFKSFYPTSRWQLFASFLIYFTIFIFSTSFYGSYIIGYKTDIEDRYPDSRVKAEIKTANLAAAFLSVKPGLYTIDQRQYPSPFDTLYCETKEEQIDFNKPYLQRFNDEYQFYTIVEKRISINAVKNYGNAYINSIYQQNISDSFMLFAYRGEVVDVSAIANTDPSYYNYSDIFLQLYGGTVTDGMFARQYQDFEYPHKDAAAAINMNKEVYDFIKKNDTQEFKKLFTTFLDMAKELRIPTNLTTDDWLQLINRSNFTIEKFIENSRFEPGKEEEDSQQYATDVTTTEVETSDDSDTSRNTPENRSKQEQFYKDRQTRFHFHGDAMQSAYENIVSIKNSTHHWIFHFQVWLAFGLSVLLFVYRTTGLPALLFSIITTIVIAILISLIAMGMPFNDGLFISYIVFAIGTVILIMPLFFLQKIKKKVQSVFVNITLAGFVPYLLLILGMIEQQQQRYYQKLLGDDYYRLKPDFVFDVLGENLSYLLLAAGFIFILAYSSIVKKWKALPEG